MPAYVNIVVHDQSGFAAGGITVIPGQQTIGSGPTISSISPNTGTAGYSVTILGSGFTNTFEVDFGGVPTSYVVNNDGSITADVPTIDVGKPITITIRVLTPNGSST